MKSVRSNKGYRVLLIATLLVLSGCYGGEPYYLRSFIEEFVMYNGISVKRTMASTSTKHLSLCIDEIGSVNFKSEGSDKKLYDELCSRYNDMSYNKEVGRPFGLPLTHAIYPHFGAINVYSDKDFDAQHPAGTLLNDVMSVRFQNARDYINSGYSDEYLPIAEKTVSLANLQPDDLELAIQNIYLIFDVEPAELSTHTLTIECINAEGKRYMAYFKYDFTLPEGVVVEEPVVEVDTIRK